MEPTTRAYFLYAKLHIQNACMKLYEAHIQRLFNSLTIYIQLPLRAVLGSYEPPSRN